MYNPKDGFIKRRLQSIQNALKGLWVLITTEDNIKVHIFIALMAVFFGFVCNISLIEWMIQCLVIALVLVAEAFNTAIEKMADFIHPEYHKKIGLIKDISAGSVIIAAILAIILGAIIYIPKILILL